MGDSAVRDPPGAHGVRVGAVHPGKKVSAPVSAVTYWRRRLVVLAVGLAALAAAGWSLSNALQVQPDRERPSTTSYGSSGGGARTHSGHQTGTRTKQQASVSPSPGASGAVMPELCPWRPIVLSLSATAVKVTAGQRLIFNLNVVSTQPADCSFNIGPGHLALVIKKGASRIWSSADCVTGTGGLVTALRRGVPTVVTIGWNKKTSAPSCDGHARSVAPGTYTAHAADGPLTSAPVAFRLR